MTSKTLVLIGFMGAGKTTVGQELAKQLKLPFLDVDDEIEQITKKSINAIFSEYGESRFRDIETEVIKQLVGFHGVIAMGGGFVERLENMNVLSQSNFQVIYLNGSLEETIHRLLISSDQRPLLKDKNVIEFMAFWEQRQPKYQSLADHVITTTGKTPKRIAQEIIDYKS